MKVAIIQFPGSNCHVETRNACSFFGIDNEVLLWTVSPAKLRDFDAYILPGGFSYQDRIRAGAIAARMTLLTMINEAIEDEKPILGICNGCQILAESACVPGFDPASQMQMALAHNQYQQSASGFVCDWSYVKVQQPLSNVFTRYFDEDEIIPIPINHGEGRFVFHDSLSEVRLSKLSSFKYVDSHGQVLKEAVNGSFSSYAGISNFKGNVFAMMPHPERAAFLKQIPISLDSKWGSRRRNLSLKNSTNLAGSCEKIFVALKESK